MGHRAYMLSRAHPAITINNNLNQTAHARIVRRHRQSSTSESEIESNNERESRQHHRRSTNKNQQRAHQKNGSYNQIARAKTPTPKHRDTGEIQGWAKHHSIHRRARWINQHYANRRKSTVFNVPTRIETIRPSKKHSIQRIRRRTIQGNHSRGAWNVQRRRSDRLRANSQIPQLDTNARRASSNLLQQSQKRRPYYTTLTGTSTK